MKILLVDDHSLFRQGLEMLLKQLDSIESIIHAESGNQAVDTIKDGADPDLILLDYNLGDGVGIDVLLRIKSRDPSIPIAIISGESNPRIVQQCLDNGASGYIQKNMDSDELLSAVQTLLDGNYYIPPNLVVKAYSEQLEEPSASSLNQMADIARNIIKNKDLSLRVDHSDEIPSEMVSAFNSLLAEMDENHSRLNDLAFTDELTGLANRRLFMERLDQAIKSARRSQKDFALLYLDLDKFKSINDTLGHDMGDELLAEVARRIQEFVREIDTVARLGGDEFSVILLDVENKDNTQVLVERILKKIQEPYQLGDTTINPGTSIGVTLCHGQSEAREIIKRADEALYRVKQRGRNGFEFY